MAVYDSGLITLTGARAVLLTIAMIPTAKLSFYLKVTPFLEVIKMPNRNINKKEWFYIECFGLI